MKMKKIILLFPLLVFLLLLAGCPAPWILENHPSSQRDTTWTTADNRVQFYIPKDYNVTCPESSFTYADRKYFLLKNDINDDVDYINYVRENYFIKNKEMDLTSTPLFFIQ